MSKQPGKAEWATHRLHAWLAAAAALLTPAAFLTVRPAIAASTPPVKLAAFDFELEDFSAGAVPTGEAASDASRLAQVTSKVRNMLRESGRYSLVDVTNADGTAAKTHTLRDCDGCDAPIALKLGADQSFVGVVRRISRTEYMVRFIIRDARTGTVLSDAKSGLRMGADYSWDRGATRLVEDRLLEARNQQ